MSEWQPISTAPSGRLLLWRADSKSIDIGEVNREYVGNPQYAYTHWMPLPPPPTDSVS